jgi:hypothetical protein
LGDVAKRNYVRDPLCGLTAYFSVIDPYRMMPTDGSAEKSNRPIVHAWCARVNINATHCNY